MKVPDGTIGYSSEESNRQITKQPIVPIAFGKNRGFNIPSISIYHQTNLFFRGFCSETPLFSSTNQWVPRDPLPSGKRLHNYGKSPFSLWKITMFNEKIHYKYKWPFSIAICMFTRGYIPLNHYKIPLSYQRVRDAPHHRSPQGH